MRVIAVNNNVFVLRDEAPGEMHGLVLPDSAQQKPNTGKIISVGKLVQDKGIQINRTAFFNKHAGFAIEVDGEEFTVLKEQEIIGLI